MIDLALGPEPLNGTTDSEGDCDLPDGCQLVILELGQKVKTSGSSTQTHVE